MIPSELAAGLTPHALLHAQLLDHAVPGLRWTSGRRTAAHNAAVGGAKNSFHLRGRAVDVVPPRGADRRRIISDAWAHRVSAGCTGPEEVIEEGDHIHIAW